MFPVKAVFWVLVVAAFVPKDFSAPEDGAFAQEAAFIAGQFNPSHAGHDVQTVADDVCVGREQTCDLIGEAADIAGFMVSLAADRVDAIATRHSEAGDEETIDQLFAQAANTQPAS